MNHQLLVGKYTLESLTSGLYITPLDLYREYVQNAADSIDQAIKDGILKDDEGRIEIEIDTKSNSIYIRDNGTGVGWEEILTTLVDIGNSHKRHSVSRGFRGIGRLSGLGYCQSLRFKTTAAGEDVVTSLEYNTSLLQKLLSPQQENRDSIDDVMQKVISISRKPEKAKTHYFFVELQGVPFDTGLMDKEQVIDYLQQNLPLPFSNDFVWGSLIRQKIKTTAFKLNEYKIVLIYDGDSHQLYKPYKNYVYSDRIRKIEDQILDIQIKTFYINNRHSATLWYAETNFYGTVLDKSVKGIRVRQGNIMVGNSFSLRHCFKEERFNGWLVGELHIIDDRLIPNTRRDSYENNSIYKDLMSQISDWAIEISKNIRHKSYERNLSQQEKSILEDELVSHPISMDRYANVGIEELETYDMDDSDSIANTDLFSKLSILMNMGNNITKYNIINLNAKMTNDQKKTVERVFDILFNNYSKARADRITKVIIENF